MSCRGKKKLAKDTELDPKNKTAKPTCNYKKYDDSNVKFSPLSVSRMYILLMAYFWFRKVRNKFTLAGNHE